MGKLAVVTAVLSALACAGVAVVAIQQGRLAARVNDLENTPKQAFVPSGNSNAGAIETLQKSIARLQSDLAVLKSAPNPSHLDTPPVRPTPGDPPNSGNSHHDPAAIEKNKQAMVDRMSRTAQVCLDRDGPTLGLSESQKAALLSILKDQIHEISQLDPADGRAKLDEAMEKINKASTEKIMLALDATQQKKYLEVSKGWFGGMMAPKKKQEPEGTPPEPGKR
ncbi:MAG: hypothetical protein K8T20_09930 [Planctomycetes bacterium]|nr:hypothetical protein [Planctomycetota bacterium]